MAENKIIQIRHEEKEYSMRWNTGAYRHFLRLFTELETQKKEDEALSLGQGMAYMDIAFKVLEGMLLRAGMPQECIDNMEATEFTDASAKVMQWFSESMNKMTQSFGGDEKNA